MYLSFVACKHMFHSILAGDTIWLECSLLEMKHETVCVCPGWLLYALLLHWHPGHNNLGNVIYTVITTLANTPSRSTNSQLCARAFAIRIHIFNILFLFIDAQSAFVLLLFFSLCKLPDYCLVDLFNQMQSFICIYLELWSQISCNTLNLSTYYIIHIVWIMCDSDGFFSIFRSLFLWYVCAFWFFMANKAYNKTNAWNSFSSEKRGKFLLSAQ